MRIGTALLIGVVAAGAVAAEAGITLTAVGSTVRVRPEGDFRGADSVDIACAQGEYESFQVVVTALGGTVTSGKVSISALTGADGTAIPAEGVKVYREVYIPVRHSAPRATCAPGWIPDALVPFVNPYTGESVEEPRWSRDGLVGGHFGANNFDVWENHHQPLWVDVYVPQGQTPGVYTGAVLVQADGVESVEIAVRLEVWGFALPDGPTHENHFGGFSRVAGYHGVEPESEAYQVLEDRYIEMMAAHRINPTLPNRLRPPVAEDGAVTFDEALDARFSEFVARYHVTNIDVPRAPFGDVLGADRAKAQNYYRTWYAYLERKGWADRAYLYMLDEPNDPEAYEAVRQLGAMVKEGAPKLRRLVVEQPYTQHPDWGVLDGAIDIWCPLFGFVHEPSVQAKQAQGDAVWSYTALVQTAPAYHPEFEAVKGDRPPFWQLDFPVVSYRIAPWLNRRYGITGLLYWSTVYWGAPDRNPWLDPGFRIRWNDDGALFYPGKDAGIEGPIASMRLKNLRDGMEDYEYFVVLENLGGKEAVEAIVREAVPTWGSWNQDTDTLPALRRRLAGEILARVK
ncbi:MAG TPA: DUF6067 family protein [Candidatus Hydrogenedentes bacterium]|nr:DUF6067 family protein [Candidatus Hydrogenedentota bacterium]HPG66024.1 DUF6067 family protein [Candidatus Hydrogenedentota bacterium]